MAYEKQTWTTGEVITQEKLNHMEDGIEDGVNGYECTETSEELFEETVKTGGGSPAHLTYSTPITATYLRVTFDGTVYTCPRIDIVGYVYYGGYNGRPDYSEFPFAIQSSNDGNNFIFTNEAGEHTVKAEATDLSVSFTPCFKTAVDAAYDGLEVFTIRQTGVDEDDKPTFNVNFNDCPQLANAFTNGKLLVRMKIRAIPQFIWIDDILFSSSWEAGNTYSFYGHSVDVWDANGGIYVRTITLEINSFGTTFEITQKKLEVTPS